MPKIKLRIKKGFFKPVHLQAIAVLVVYYAVSNFIFFGSVIHSNIYVSFLAPFVFGLLSSFVFLYLFSHEDFFYFIKDIEKKEGKREGEFLKKGKHFGKVAAVIVVALIGGSVFAALTVRLLLPHYKYKYFVLLAAMFLSTVFSMGLAKGIFNFLH